MIAKEYKNILGNVKIHSNEIETNVNEKVIAISDGVESRIDVNNPSLPISSR